MNPFAIQARQSRDYEHPSMRVHTTVGKLSAGTFIVVIISVVLGLAFFTIMPSFITDAVAALDATNDSAAITMLQLLPFVVAALFIAFAVLYLIKEFKNI